MWRLGKRAFELAGRSPQILSIIAIFSLSVIGAAVTGFDLQAIVRLSSVCAILSVSGIFLLAPLGDISRENIPELIAKGIGVGIPVAALSHQLFLHSPLRPVGWVVPTLFTLPRIVSHLKYLRKLCISESQNTTTELLALVTYAFVAMMYDGWWFLIPPCLLLAGILIPRHMRLERRKASPNDGNHESVHILFLGCTFMVSIVVARYFAERNFLYFFQSFDQLFRSAIAAGLNEWGASDHIAAVGTPLRYHWLAEASVGLIAKLSGSATLQVVLRFAPFLFMCAASAALWSLAKRFGLSHAGMVLGFGSILWLNGLFDTIDLNTVRHPLSFALFFLFLGSLSDYETSPKRLKYVLHIAMFCPLILITDTALGVIVCITTVLISLLNGILGRVSRRDALLLIVVGPLSLMSMSLTILNAKSDFIYSPEFGLKNILQFGRNAFDIYVGPNPWFIALASLAILSAGSFRWIGLYGTQNLAHLFRAPNITCFTPAIVGLLLVNSFSMGASLGTAQQVVFLVGLVALPLVSADAITRDFEHERYRVGFWLPTIVLGLIIGFLLHYSYGLELGGNRQLALISIMTIPVIVLLTVRSVEWFSAQSDGRKRSRARVLRQGVQVAILVSLFASSSFGILAGAKNLTKSVRDDHGYLGNPAQLECLSWIRENTSRQSIVVSNLWHIPLPTQDSKYFLVSNQTERRVLIDGPLYIDHSMSGWVADRMKWSEEFIDAPSAGSFEYMKSMKVSVAYIDFQYTKNRTLEPFATTTFMNDGCLVAILK